MWPAVTSPLPRILLDFLFARVACLRTKSVYSPNVFQQFFRTDGPHPRSPSVLVGLHWQHDFFASKILEAPDNRDAKPPPVFGSRPNGPLPKHNQSSASL